MTPLADRNDITDPYDIEDISDSSENEDAALNAEANDPTDPIDRAEPTDPMDRTDPRDPMERMESCDHRDHFDDGLIRPILHARRQRTVDSPWAAARWSSMTRWWRSTAARAASPSPAATAS